LVHTSIWSFKTINFSNYNIHTAVVTVFYMKFKQNIKQCIL
jgi:hypothetical protein